LLKNCNRGAETTKNNCRDAIYRVSTDNNIVTNVNDNVKFRNQYRIKSTRLPDYDYGKNGAYFVTICTENRKHFFGNIDEDKIQWSNIGKIANDYWQQIPQQFSFVTLGEWIIMPNHIHGILIFDTHTDCLSHDLCVTTMMNRDAINRDAINRDAINRVSTICGGITKNNNPMLKQNLSTVIRWFKGKTTFEIRKNYLKFAWQPRFYDHVIRNEKDYNAIVEYIIFNPQNWQSDENFI